MVLFSLLLAFLLSTPAFAAPAPGGPMWWKVSDGGGSVLWIMGMPDGMPMDTEWNDAALRRRLGKADRLISPLLGAALNEAESGWTPGSWVPVPPSIWGVQGAESARMWNDEKLFGNDREARPAGLPFSYAVSTSPGVIYSQNRTTNLFWERTLGRTDPERTFNDPTSKRLPPAMQQRVNQAMPVLLGEIPTLLRNGKTWELAAWLDLWNWPRGKLLGNPVTTKAQSLAQSAHVPVELVYTPALWKPILLDQHPYSAGDEQWADFDWLFNIQPSLIEPPEAVQQKCLGQVLDQAESGTMPARRLAAAAAWGRGDLDNALKRSSTLQLCLMGEQPSTSARDFEVRQAALYLASLDKAFDQKGETVALVEFDALLLKDGGVLDHYRKLGFEITTGDGME